MISPTGHCSQSKQFSSENSFEHVVPWSQSATRAKENDSALLSFFVFDFPKCQNNNPDIFFMSHINYGATYHFKESNDTTGYWGET